MQTMPAAPPKPGCRKNAASHTWATAPYPMRPDNRRPSQRNTLPANNPEHIVAHIAEQRGAAGDVELQQLGRPRKHQGREKDHTQALMRQCQPGEQTEHGKDQYMHRIPTRPEHLDLADQVRQPRNF